MKAKCKCETENHVEIPVNNVIDSCCLHKFESGWLLMFDNTLRNVPKPEVKNLVCGGAKVYYCPLCGRKLED